MNLIQRIISKLKWVRKNYVFCLWRTLYFNFRMLPFKQAIHLPVVFYGKIEFWELNGKVEIVGPCHFAMVKWGAKRDGFSPKNIPGSLFLTYDAKWLIRGDVSINPGCCLRIIGTLEFSDKSAIGSRSIVACNNYVYIGYNSRIAFNSFISDTNFHYTDIDGKVYPKEGCVRIGDNCWIGNNTSLAKGAVIPNNSIVAARSLVNKDFSSDGENILLAGLPAKVKMKGIRRIFDTTLEARLQNYFAQHPGEEFYLLSESEKEIL